MVQIMGNEKYTIDELKSMLAYYLSSDGEYMGRAFFKAHLNEEKKFLPETVTDLDLFIEEHRDEVLGDDELESESLLFEQLIEIKRDLLVLKKNSASDERDKDFEKFIKKWLDRLEEV